MTAIKVALNQFLSQAHYRHLELQLELRAVSNIDSSTELVTSTAGVISVTLVTSLLFLRLNNPHLPLSNLELIILLHFNSHHLEMIMELEFQAMSFTSLTVAIQIASSGN